MELKRKRREEKMVEEDEQKYRTTVKKTHKKKRLRSRKKMEKVKDKRQEEEVLEGVREGGARIHKTVHVRPINRESVWKPYIRDSIVQPSAPEILHLCM